MNITKDAIATHLNIDSTDIISYEVWAKKVLVKLVGAKPFFISKEDLEQAQGRLNREPRLTQEEIELNITKRELRVIGTLLVIANLNKPDSINPRTVASIKAILTKEAPSIDDYYKLETIAEVFSHKDNDAAALWSALNPLPARETTKVGYAHIDTRDWGKDDHYWQSLTNEG